MKGFLMVGGCPRSGTSVCMDIQREAHGEDSILGYKFPQENRRKSRDELLDRMPYETDSGYEVRKFLIGKEIMTIEMQEQEEELKRGGDGKNYIDMNPEGFWECQFSVRGIIYQPQFMKLLKDVKSGKDFKVVKVVSQGMLASDPQYIGKMIYMIRHPRQVAKSQERLVRGFDFTDTDGTVKNAFHDKKIHTPEMYIQVTCQAAEWFLLNPRKKVLFINFDDLQANPKEECQKMQEFVGFGDYSKASKLVQKKLNRSKPEDIDNVLWEDSEYVYNKFMKAAKAINNGEGRGKANRYFRDIIKYFHDPKRAFNREKRQWGCYRAKMGVNEKRCKACYYKKDGLVAGTLKKYSENNVAVYGVTRHWTKEPCIFEMGMDLDREEPYLTAEESIANNFWEDLPDLPPELQEKSLEELEE